MKVVIYKSYSKSTTVYSNYGDDSDEVWHNFKAIENVKEVTADEFEVLKKAVNHFNAKGGRNYTLGLLEILEDEEVDCLLSNFKEYETKEIVKAEKLHRERLENAKLAKEKAEANKNEKALKKFSKELNLSVEEVRVMLANKK